MPRANLFEKGNPGGPGRPKANAVIAEYIKGETNDLKEVAQKVIDLLRKTKKESTALWAAEWLRDTTIGKPKQMLDVGGEGVADLLKSVLELREQRGLSE